MRCGAFICRPCTDAGEGKCLDCLERVGWTPDNERLAIAWVGVQQRRVAVALGSVGFVVAFSAAVLVYFELLDFLSYKLAGIVSGGAAVGVLMITRQIVIGLIHLRARAWCDAAAEKFAIPKESLEALRATLKV